ncbi:PTS fructose transporter subunit IIC, partial [Vibrio sp. Vb1554]|uniref:PTS fructose transporter subunit IIC n=1 Tax=Vibrio sp. Vb1554 TaxID=3074642 RepID=UPI002966CF57
LGTFITCGAIMWVIGSPIASSMLWLNQFLASMADSGKVALGAVLGAMTAFDMGGPINKVATLFAQTQVNTQPWLMGGVGIAICTPPLGMALATLLSPSKFKRDEREAGKASFVLGLCFISEGAIPFAAKDPMRVIPSCMAGGALTGALSMLFGAKLMAPHGGLFVLLIPNAISPVLMYLVAIAAGTAVTGFTYAFLKNKADAKQEVAA